MKTRRIMMALLASCVLAGFAMAEPEPTPEKTKGQIIGTIVEKRGAIITVKGEKGQLTVMPYWRGGMPADGGGLDKEMLKQLQQFKVGDAVKVKWTFEEHYRIDDIKRLGRKTPGGKIEKDDKAGEEAKRDKADNSGR